MRTIKHPLYLLALFVLSLFSSCTKYDFVETGKAKGYHDTTMWEYFQTDSYNWSYLVYMAKRAGLEDLFQGKSTESPSSGSRIIVSVAISSVPTVSRPMDPNPQRMQSTPASSQKRRR